MGGAKIEERAATITRLNQPRADMSKIVNGEMQRIERAPIQLQNSPDINADGVRRSKNVNGWGMRLLRPCEDSWIL